jgi:hypothetical protein
MAALNPVDTAQLSHSNRKVKYNSII